MPAIKETGKIRSDMMAATLPRDIPGASQTTIRAVGKDNPATTGTKSRKARRCEKKPMTAGIIKTGPRA